MLIQQALSNRGVATLPVPGLCARVSVLRYAGELMLQNVIAASGQCGTNVKEVRSQLYHMDPAGIVTKGIVNKAQLNPVHRLTVRNTETPASTSCIANIKALCCASGIASFSLCLTRSTVWCVRQATCPIVEGWLYIHMYSIQHSHDTDQQVHTCLVAVTGPQRNDSHA